MPLSSWQLCLLSDRISVIKCDSLSFLTETLKVSSPPSPLPFYRLYIRSTLDLSIRHVWIVLLLTAPCCGDAVDKRQREATAKTSPWRKHKSRKQPDMTETSPWLWWVTTGAKQQRAAVAHPEKQPSESLRDELRWHYTHQAQWQLWWIGFVSLFFPPAITHSARAAAEPQQTEERSVVSVGYWIVFVLLF